MRWFGTVYTPLMAVLGLLFLVLSLFGDFEDAGPRTLMLSGAILAAGACISGSLRHKE